MTTRKRNGPMSKAEQEMIESGLAADPAPAWDGVITYPDQLNTKEQREIYARLFSDYPSKHLLNAGGQALFVQLVRLIIRANMVDDVLSSGQISDPTELGRMLKTERDLTMAISSALTRLRMTPQSISNFRGNLLDKTPTDSERGNKPWNFGKPREQWR